MGILPPTAHHLKSPTIVLIQKVKGKVIQTKLSLLSNGFVQLKTMISSHKIKWMKIQRHDKGRRVKLTSAAR